MRNNKSLFILALLCAAAQGAWADEAYNCSFAYRISGKNFGFANEIKSVPLYAAFCIEAIIFEPSPKA